MTETERTALRLRITGRVQGVGYRAWTEQEATRLGVDGWVRNREDGSVEALVAGPVKPVETLIGHCYQGPSLARVDDIRITEEADPGPVGFRQEATR